MALNWTTRLAKASLILAGCYLTMLYIDPTRGTVDANERVKEVVEAVAASQLDRPFELTPLEIAEIQPVSMVERLRVSGELEPINRAVLLAKDGGKIIEVRAREGQAIKAGDVLVRFDTADLQSVLKQREGDRDVARAEMLLAMQSLKRIEQLVDKNIAAHEQLDKARSEVAATTARLKSLSAQTDIARTALTDAEVLAPFDGVVASRAVNQGSHVSAGAELFTIVDTTILEAKVLVSTRDVPRVAVDQTVELQIDGLDEQLVTGRVARISPVAENGTRFIPLYIQLSNHDGRLWGGMFAIGSILVPLAMAAAGGGAQRAPMAHAVIGGLISSTILTLIVMPVILSYIDSLTRWFSRTMQTRHQGENLSRTSSEGRTVGRAAR